MESAVVVQIVRASLVAAALLCCAGDAQSATVKLENLCSGWALWRSPAGDLYIVCPRARVDLPPGTRLLAQDYAAPKPPPPPPGTRAPSSKRNVM